MIAPSENEVANSWWYPRLMHPVLDGSWHGIVQHAKSPGSSIAGKGMEARPFEAGVEHCWQ